ncbi:NAD(P)-dependent oxidoreductase [Halorarius halobius]|uniref:NAD(P)-dependent oxidoreductase n=1 Tax=Halorarius halobius TaxID=2962671 RepID=UPI0020CE68D1|nr:NAD(P)-dependent oxidoreductase [Halorarius halobius]
MAHRVVTTDTKTAEVLPEAFTWQGFDADVQVVEEGDEERLVRAAAAGDADAVVVDAGTPVTERLFTETPVRVVGRAGVGVDNVALGAAREYGIPVVNVPDYCTEEVATHALSLLLSTWRRLGPYDDHVQNGGWSRDPGVPVGRLSNATLGFLSFGASARRLAELVRGFDLEGLAYDPHVDDPTLAEYGVEGVELEPLLRRSDLLALLAPLTPQTRGLLDESAFGLMKRSAVVVNVGRGGVVDTDALAAALDAGEIAGAGLDVLDQEPPSSLPTAHPNVVYTPHVGWYSEEAIRECADTLATDIARVLTGGDPDHPVDPGW